MPWRRLLFLLPLVAIAAIAYAALLQPRMAEAADDTITTTLYPGWNLIGWIDGATTVDAVFADLQHVTSIYDSAGQSAYRDRPESASSLTRLETGQGYWLRLDSASPHDWTRLTRPRQHRFFPRSRPSGGRVAGPDHTSVQEALVGIQEQLRVAWRWLGAEQRFAPWRLQDSVPGADTFSLGRGDALLVNLEAPVEWFQPTGLLPKIIGQEQVSLSLLRVIERDIYAVETVLTGKFQVPIDQSKVTLRLVANSPQTALHFDPCCPQPEAWVSRVGSSETGFRYEITMPARSWKDGSWISADLGRGGGYTTLLHEYFHILQFELTGVRADQVPQWILEGTAIWLWSDLDLALDHGFLSEFWSNQLDISVLTYPYRRATTWAKPTSLD